MSEHKDQEEPKEQKELKAKPRPAARPSAKAKKEPPPLEPSPREPQLQDMVQRIKKLAGEEAIEEAYVNQNGAHLPTLVVKKEYWLQVASLLYEQQQWQYIYLQNCSGVDYQSYLEVMFHLYSIQHNDYIAVKVKTDPEQVEIPSVSGIWQAANWNEREIFDLLGVVFTGHPNLTRILMPDSWVGHPLRKDYEPLDEGV